MLKHIQPKFCSSCINPTQYSQRWIGSSFYIFNTNKACTYSHNNRFRWCAYPKTCKFLHDYKTIEKYGQCMKNNFLIKKSY